MLWHSLPADSDRASHYDLMFEADGVLHTWALETEPVAGTLLSITQLPNHRLAYLEFEGEISGGRGNVVRQDAGTYCLRNKSDERWELIVAGTRLQGRLILQRQENQRWTLSLSTAADFSDGTSS